MKLLCACCKTASVFQGRRRSSRNLSGWIGSQAGRSWAAPDVGTGVGDPIVCTRQGRKILNINASIPSFPSIKLISSCSSVHCNPMLKSGLLPLGFLHKSNFQHSLQSGLCFGFGNV
ncbi:hypothetical protein Nmel_003744 [Mimus melanotis]